jgi:elongation factor P
MATTADFRNGLCLEWNNDLYSIVEFQHVKPGKGGAFVRTKLRNLKSGRILENTFTAGEKIVTARVEKRTYQFLYKDEFGFNFMDNDTFEQLSLGDAMVPQADLMKEGSNIDILIHAETETPLSVEMPAYVELRIVYTEPGVRGDTATNATKPAKVETGASIKVPLFIDNDELIKVNTTTYEYDSRVKEK